MKLKSEAFSTILKILLAGLIILSALVLITSTLYLADNSFYGDTVYSIYSFGSSVSSILYIIIVVVYLIWIYRVHMDLNVCFPNYQRTPGEALACNMIPFYNFYGLPSTYLIIGRHFQLNSGVSKKYGSWIKGLAIPLVLCFIVSYLMDRILARASDDLTNTLIITSNIMDLITFIVYITLCFLISKGLQQIQQFNIEGENKSEFKLASSDGAAM